MLTVFVQAALLILAVLCFGYAVKRALRQKKIDCLIFLLGGTLLVLAEYFSWIDGYWLSVIKFMGLNVIFAASLNLVNGYMGEFSCGHAGFMCVGAYGRAFDHPALYQNKLLGAPLLRRNWPPCSFPASGCGGPGGRAVWSAGGAALAKTCDDYLAIITIAANHIIIALIIQYRRRGQPARPLSGMRAASCAPWSAMADIPWMMIWIVLSVAASVMLLYRLVNSTLGKGIPAVCRNEVAAEIMSVNTKKVKLTAFMEPGRHRRVAGAGLRPPLQLHLRQQFWHRQVHGSHGHGLSGRHGLPFRFGAGGHHVHAAHRAAARFAPLRP